MLGSCVLIKSIVRWVFFNVPVWSPLPSKFSLPQVVQTRFYPVGYPAYGDFNEQFGCNR